MTKFALATRIYTDPMGKRKVRHICSSCKKEHREDYGIIIQYKKRNHEGIIRYGFCHECAEDFVTYLIKILEFIDYMVQMKRKNKED